MARLTTNIKRLWNLCQPSHGDIWLVGGYTVFISVLFLVVPFAAQGIVNALTSGLFNQPGLVLGLAVFIGLGFAGILRVLQLQLVELIQQKLFVTVAMNTTRKLLSVSESTFRSTYPPELLNRFFDTVTLQKTLAKLLLDIPSSILQIVIGLILISLYSYWFVLFSLAVFVGLAVVIIAGRDGFVSSLEESTTKYRVAQWLEEISLSHISFKMNGGPTGLLRKTDRLLNDYLDARQSHFRIVLRQSAIHFAFEALVSTGVLVIGGFLVMNGQLTIGQLVAAEIVILVIISAFDKVVAYLESGYDMLTSVDKLHYLLEMEQEPDGGAVLPELDMGLHLKCEDVTFGYNPDAPVLKGLTLELPVNSHSSVVGSSGAGKSTLAALICGLEIPQDGSITLNGVENRYYSMPQLRTAIGLVSNSSQIFEGTVEDNILLGMNDDELPDGGLDWVISVTQLGKDLKLYPLGLQHQLTTSGTNISLGQRQRIILARAIIQQPRLLILDEAFTGMDEATKLTVLDNLFALPNGWTILNISHDGEIVERTDNVFVMEQGVVLASGSPKQLARSVDGPFAQLFPSLASRLRGRTY